MRFPGSDLELYIRQVLEMYRHTPGTLGRVRREDRRLAADLKARGVPLLTIEHALLLATARRELRAPDLTPLAPVRSLHYFLPVIEELLLSPLPNLYPDYLKSKLQKVQTAHDNALERTPRKK